MKRSRRYKKKMFLKSAKKALSCSEQECWIYVTIILSFKEKEIIQKLSKNQFNIMLKLNKRIFKALALSGQYKHFEYENDKNTETLFDDTNLNVMRLGIRKDLLKIIENQNLCIKRLIFT